MRMKQGHLWITRDKTSIAYRNFMYKVSIDGLRYVEVGSTTNLYKHF